MPTKTTPTPSVAPTETKVRKEPVRLDRRDFLSFGHQAYAQMTAEDQAFFTDLLQEYVRGPYSMREMAFNRSCRAMGFGWLGHEPEGDTEHVQDVDTLARILDDADCPSSFLRTLCQHYRNNPEKKFTPDDLVVMLDDDLAEFHIHLEQTREILQKNPECVADTLREVASKRPELFHGDAA